MTDCTECEARRADRNVRCPLMMTDYFCSAICAPLPASEGIAAYEMVNGVLRPAGEASGDRT